MQAIQNDYFSKIDSAIDEIKKNFNNPVTATHKIVDLLEEKIAELRLFLLSHKFKSEEEEIQFFKEEKPRLISKLIYYNSILEIEANLPLTKKDKIDFIKMRLKEISLFTDRNKLFYQYYRSKATYNDVKYFTRTVDRKINYFQTHFINYDIRFCTSHDYNVSQFMAHELLVSFLERKLQRLNADGSLTEEVSTSKLNWTGNRIDFIELLYALQTQKVINNGSLEMKEFATAFGKMFNIELEDSIYRSYHDIKSRKSSRTKFLNTLSETLNSRMEEEEV